MSNRNAFIVLVLSPFPGGDGSDALWCCIHCRGCCHRAFLFDMYSTIVERRRQSRGGARRAGRMAGWRKGGSNAGWLSGLGFSWPVMQLSVNGYWLAGCLWNGISYWLCGWRPARLRAARQPARRNISAGWLPGWRSRGNHTAALAICQWRRQSCGSLASMAQWLSLAVSNLALLFLYQCNENNHAAAAATA